MGVFRNAIAAAGVAAVLAGCALWRPIGAIEVGAPTAPEPASAESRANVELTGHLTGWVEAPANILIDQGADGLPEALQSPQWAPSVAYLARHPSRGAVILDTGLRAGACDYGLRPVYWVPCRNAPGGDLVSQLKASGLAPQEIRHIIPSHFHGDHISGLGALLDYADAPVLVTQAALDEVRSPLRALSGVPARMLAADMRVEVIDAAWREDARLGRVFDVFGDGSLKLLPTPGHSAGHVSALARTAQGEVLLAFDAAHLRANLELGVPSGASASKRDAKESLQRIARLAQANPDLRVVFGHEPAQWACIDRAARLGPGGAPCDDLEHE